MGARGLIGAESFEVESLVDCDPDVVEEESVEDERFACADSGLLETPEEECAGDCHCKPASATEGFSAAASTSVDMNMVPLVGRD